MSVKREDDHQREAITSTHAFAVYLDDAWQVTIVNLQALRQEEVFVLPSLEINGLQW